MGRRTGVRRTIPVTTVKADAVAEPSGPAADVVAAAARPAADVLRDLGVTADRGRTDADVVQGQARWGPNTVSSHRARVFPVLWHQLRSPLLGLLLAAALASALLGQRGDAVIIAAIVIVSVGLGFTNEYRAEKAAEALHSRIRHETTVVRDGTRSRVDVTDRASRWDGGVNTLSTCGSWSRAPRRKGRCGRHVWTTRHLDGHDRQVRGCVLDAHQRVDLRCQGHQQGREEQAGARVWQRAAPEETPSHPLRPARREGNRRAFTVDVRVPLGPRTADM
jgi:hypothetical protein